MTRLEQIREVAKSLHSFRMRQGFINGAMWADAHPADETIQRIVTLYKEWYTTESSTGMVDYIKQHLKS